MQKPKLSKEVFNTIELSKSPYSKRILDLKHSNLENKISLLTNYKNRLLSLKFSHLLLQKDSLQFPISNNKRKININSNNNIISNNKSEKILNRPKTTKHKNYNSYRNASLILNSINNLSTNSTSNNFSIIHYPPKQKKHYLFNGSALHNNVNSKKIYKTKSASLDVEKSKIFNREIAKKEDMLTLRNVKIPKQKLLKKLKNIEGILKFTRILKDKNYRNDKKKRTFKMNYFKDTKNLRNNSKSPISKTTGDKFKFNNIQLIQKDGNYLKEKIKDSIKNDKKFKSKDDWFFGYKQREFKEKVRVFKQLKRDCGHIKVSKSNFMKRMIKFDSFNRTMEILGAVDMNVAYSQREFISTKVGFKWRDPFHLNDNDEQISYDLLELL